MENFPALSYLLILVLNEPVYHKEILRCEMQPMVVLEVMNLIKTIFQCDDGQILIYQNLRAMLDGMEVSM